MINNRILVWFIIAVIILVISLLLTKKISITIIFKSYFSIYYGGFYNKSIDNKDDSEKNTNEGRKTERRVSFSAILCLGICPYAVGALGFLTFYEFIKQIDLNVLANFDSMMLAIITILFGFDTFKRNEISTRKLNALYETNGVLFVSMMLILLEHSILSIISIDSISPSLVLVLFTIYYSIKCKVIALFIVLLHNVFSLNLHK